MRLTDAQIEFILLAEVAAAKEAFATAKPLPAREHDLATEAYRAALREFSAFLNDGVVPDRLKEPSGLEPAAKQA